VAQPGTHLIPTVVYASWDGHIHEIALKGTWQHRDLTAAAGAPAAYDNARAMAYRRSDGVDMVLYRGVSDHIYALYLELLYQGGSWQEVWPWADLSAMTGSPAAKSDPYGYVRSDGISTVIYVGADGHIHDLRLESSWIWADLTAISGAPTAATSTTDSPVPVPYVRGDGINTVVYRAASDGHIVELRLDNGWKYADLTAISGAPLPLSQLSAYVRSAGISTINYTGSDGHVVELRLDNTWQWADLTSLAGETTTAWGRPFAYVRGDKINAVVYASYSLSGHVYELWLGNGWQSDNLSSAGSGWGYEPVGYVRADGISAVVCRSGAPYHIREVRLERDGWHWADLTVLAGVPTASISGGWPWAYNRRAVVNVYLPCLLRSS